MIDRIWAWRGQERGQPSGRFCGLALGATTAFLITGCSTTSDSSQIQQLTTAATAFAQQASSLEHAQDASIEEANAKIGRYIVTGQQLIIDSSCASKINNSYKIFVKTVDKNTNEQDAAYANVLKSVSPCANITLYTPNEPNKKDFLPLSATTLAPPTPPQGAVLYPAVSEALNKYLTGLAMIAAASDVSAVEKGYTDAATAANAIATAAGAPPIVAPALTFSSKIAGVAIQQAQYEALKKIVVPMDAVLPAGAPTLALQMRLQQGYNLILVADQASRIAELLSGDFTDPTLLKDRQLRLSIYATQIQPLNDANAILVASAKTDPASTVSALVSAHHKLAEVLAANSNQTGSILSALQSLVQGGKSVLNAAAPAKKGT